MNKKRIHNGDSAGWLKCQAGLLMCLVAWMALTAASRGPTLLWQPTLQTNLNAAGYSLTNISSVTASNFYGSYSGNGGALTNLPPSSYATTAGYATNAGASGVASFATNANYATNSGNYTRVYVTTFTNSTTYTPHAGLVDAMIECKGGGGGGGGSLMAFALGGNQFIHGNPGGQEGAYSRVIKTSSQVGSGGQTITIGAGGAGADGNTAYIGGTGGNTSWSTNCVSPGGVGGVCFTAQSSGFLNHNNVLNLNGYVPVLSGAVGDYVQYGQTSTASILSVEYYPGGSFANGVSSGRGGGEGGGSAWEMDLANQATNSWGSYPGSNGGGGGGAGICCLTNTAPTVIVGGNGGNGYVRITEYCTQ